MAKDVFAIYFPSWHPDKHYEKWYGKGFCEWELVKTTKPLFEGHYQPRRPLWGYFDESDPEMMAKQMAVVVLVRMLSFMMRRRPLA